jgi:hypothetical protein
MSTYRCRYCRGVHDGSSPSCPLCGAPIDITARVTDSGWMEQPMIGDMTRIRCGDTRCQIAGTLVQVAEFSLGSSDWIYFSHHALLWTDALTSVRNILADDRPDRWLSSGRAVDPRGRPIPGLDLSLHLEHPRDLGAASMKDPHNYRVVWLRLRGSGRVAVQSVYEPAESAGTLDIFSFDTRRSW